MENNRVGQYGKRNPLFMYQCGAGYSIRAAVVKYAANSEQKDVIFEASPSQSGMRRCGTVLAK